MISVAKFHEIFRDVLSKQDKYLKSANTPVGKYLFFIL